MDRRHFLRAAAVTTAFFRPDAIERVRAATLGDKQTVPESARNEDFWREIQDAFDVDRSIVNLNNAGVCPSPRVVQNALRRSIEFTNGAPAYDMWAVLEPQVENVRARLANDFGVDPEEIAITRNASEALEIVQLGLDLKSGDEVLSTDHDYDRMRTTWNQRARREGIVVKTIKFPAEPSFDSIYDLFERNIGPRTRVLHICT